MSKDTNVPIRTVQYDAIQKFIDDHPEQGYHSVAEAVRESNRQWLQRKKLEEKMLIIREENDFEIE